MPKDVLGMTHKEFVMLCEENIEITHDDNEKQAMYAIMYAAASRGKGKQQKLPSIKELYDRDVANKNKNKSNGIDDVMEDNKRAMDWLSNFDLTKFTGKEDE